MRRSRTAPTPFPPTLPACLVLAALALGPAWTRPAEGALRPEERRLVTAVDRHAPAAFALLERAVDVNSGTMNFEGVRAVGRLFEPELHSLGFSTRWADGAAWGRAGHLIATRPGKGRGPRVLLIGHLDTVFEADSPFQRFERLSDSTARGPGVIDMKGGDVVMLLALRALADARLLDRLAVTVVMTGDEEQAGEPLSLARRDLLEAADWADVALGFEDGDGDPNHTVTARRGASSWVLRCEGQPAHSSLIFRDEVGSGAIYECARILQAFHDTLSREPFLTVNPGVALGGTSIDFDRDQGRGTAFGKTNVVAESCVVAGDLRTLSLPQRELARAAMRRIVAASPPHARAEIRFDDGYPPLSPSDGNRRLFEMLDAASRDLAFPPLSPVDPSRAGAADVSFTEGRVEMAIDALGLKGEGGHTVRETALMHTLPIQAKRAAVLLARLARDTTRGRAR